LALRYRSDPLRRAIVSAIFAGEDHCPFPSHDATPP
jgi:hypothetical protein